MIRPLFALTLGLLLLPVEPVAQGYVPAYERGVANRAETELVLVYFGASWCLPCTTDELKTSLERAKVAVAEQAQREGKAFAAIGVALDHDVDEGLAFLAESGGFDEIVVGREWYNSAASNHLWRRDRTGSPGVPTIVVFEKEMRMGTVTSETTYRAEASGLEPIVEWAEAGSPLE